MKKKILTLIALTFLILVSFSFVSALTINAVTAKPNEIAPGESTKISLVIKNNLGEDVTDVSVSLDLSQVPFAPLETSNEITIDELREDKDRILNFDVVALDSAESGIYKIPIKIEYYDTNNVKQEKSSLISLIVNSKPILDVDTEESLLLKGQQNEVTLKVINKGASDVKFLEMEVGSSAQYTLLSPEKLYIGEIKSDDFETNSFKIFFKENSLNIVSIPVTLTYKDITNKEYREEYNVDLRVYNQQQALSLGLVQKNNTAYIVVGIIVVVVLYLIYRSVRKRLKAKKARQEAAS